VVLRNRVRAPPARYDPHPHPVSGPARGLGFAAESETTGLHEDDGTMLRWSVGFGILADGFVRCTVAGAVTTPRGGVECSQ